jgi:hypothetical protein
MMRGRRKARGGQRRATIRDGVCFFSAEDLSDAKPVPEADRDEYALGVALVTYGIGPGIKKFQERGEAGVTKELTQMHDMNVFRPIMKDDLTRDERKKTLTSLMFLKEKETSRSRRECALMGEDSGGIGPSRTLHHPPFQPSRCSSPRSSTPTRGETLHVSTFRVPSYTRIPTRISQ